jgi:RHS repeat-associated protein
LLRRYVHGPGTDDPLIQYEGAGVASTAERLLYADAQGSIIATTDGGGALMPGGIDKYDEYGIPQTDTAGHSLNSGRFQYTGQQWIGELGVYYYKNRLYSPTLGRFFQTDPVGYDGGINIYEYADDDPVDHSDPSGLCLDNCPVGSGDANADRLTRNAEMGLDANGKSYLNPAPGVTVGIGGTMGYTLKNVALSAGSGVMFDSKGHSRSYVEGSANVGRANSAGKGGNVGLTVSVATGHVSEQGGRFNNVHGQLGPVAVTVYQGTNRGPQVYGVSVTVGPGAGASAGAGPSNTSFIAPPKAPMNFPTIKPAPACNRDMCM